MNRYPASMRSELPIGSIPQPGAGTLMALGIDAQSVHLALLESIRSVYRLAAWTSLPRQGERHLGDQVASACRQLGATLGRRLWDESANMPLLSSNDPVRHPPLEELSIALSPRYPLRVWLAGITEGYSLRAARQTVASTQAVIAGATQLTIDLDAEQLAQALRAAGPELLVVAGGYDLPDPNTYQSLQLLGNLLAGALLRLPHDARPAVCLAGNRWAASAVQETLQPAELTVAVVPNVMPAPGQLRQDALAYAVEEYAWKLTSELDGFGLLSQWHTAPAPPASLEMNFIRLVQTWLMMENLAEIHAVYHGVRRLHVWAVEGQVAVTAVYVEPDAELTHLTVNEGWPPILLASGFGSTRNLPESVRWWDRRGLAPVAAGLGSTTPAALYQTLKQDILIAPDATGAETSPTPRRRSGRVSPGRGA